jgi:hypothetical protein
LCSGHVVACAGTDQGARQSAEEGKEKLVATMTGTLLALFGREGIAQ